MGETSEKWAEVALGLVTGIGGFLEIGSLATTSQAGAEFGFQLAWVVVVGTLGLAFLMEMTGESLPSEHLERWLSERVVRRIPGAEGDRK